MLSVFILLPVKVIMVYAFLFLRYVVTS